MEKQEYFTGNCSDKRDLGGEMGEKELPPAAAAARTAPATPARSSRKRSRSDSAGFKQSEKNLDESWKQMRLRDCPGEGLRFLVVGINPGAHSARSCHHYAGPTNHFWPLLVESGLTGGVHYTFRDDHRLPAEQGIGFTNLVSVPTRSSSDLTKKDMVKAAPALAYKIRQWKPRLVVFNGKGAYEAFSGKRSTLVRFGLQAPGTSNWTKHLKTYARAEQRKVASHSLALDEFDFRSVNVGSSSLPDGVPTEPLFFCMPSTSARVSNYQRADKLQIFLELKRVVEKYCCAWDRGAVAVGNSAVSQSSIQEQSDLTS